MTMSAESFQIPDVGSNEWYSFDDHQAYFGLGHLSVTEAAILMAFNADYMKQIEDSDLSDDIEDVRIADHSERERLADQIEMYGRKICLAIMGGWLKANATHDIDGDLIPNKTYVERDDFLGWVECSGFWGGDEGEPISEWLDKNNDAFGDVASFVGTRRGLMPYEREQLADNPALSEESVLNLFLENRQLKQRIERLEGGRTARTDRPVTTRQRRTLLTIIAALCDYSAIKPNERGAAGQIASMTEELGAPITAETIARFLKEIPDAVETRMK